MPQAPTKVDTEITEWGTRENAKRKFATSASPLRHTHRAEGDAANQQTATNMHPQKADEIPEQEKQNTNSRMHGVFGTSPCSTPKPPIVDGTILTNH